MFQQILIRALPVLIVGVLLLHPSPAEARRRGIPIGAIINTGKTVKHVADVPQEHRAAIQRQLESQDVAIGYVHSRFGLFWLDLWT